jgi:hypothetical protein
VVRACKRLGQVLTLAIVVVMSYLAFAGSANAAPSVPPTPTNVAGQVDQTTGDVRLTWKLPPTLQLIDAYIIYRNDQNVGQVTGQAGITPREYTDRPGGNTTLTYRIQSVNSEGTKSARSDPYTTSIGPLTPTQTGTSGLAIVDTPNICKGLVVPDLKGHNLPNAQESYACTPGMITVPDKLSITNQNDWFWLIIAQFVKLLTVIKTFSSLVGSGLLSWSTDATSYKGLSGLLGNTIASATGTTTFADAILYAIAASMFAYSLYLLKGQHRKLSIMLMISMLSLVALGYMTNDTQPIVDKAVLFSPHAENYIVGQSDKLITDAVGKENLHGLSVTGSYTNYSAGDAPLNARRRADNQDWIIHDYLPMCELYTGDSDWSTKTLIPAKSGRPQITWCEALLRMQDGISPYADSVTKCSTTGSVIGSVIGGIVAGPGGAAAGGQAACDGTTDTQFDLVKELAVVNPVASNVYAGKSWSRVLTAGTTGGASVIHNLNKMALAAAFAFTALLLGFYVFMSIVALLGGVMGWERSVNFMMEWIERITNTLFRTIRISCLLLLVYAAETMIYNWTDGHGVYQTMICSAILNLLMLAYLIKQFMNHRARVSFSKRLDDQFVPRISGGTPPASDDGQRRSSGHMDDLPPDISVPKVGEPNPATGFIPQPLALGAFDHEVADATTFDGFYPQAKAKLTAIGPGNDQAPPDALPSYSLAALTQANDVVDAEIVDDPTAKVSQSLVGNVRQGITGKQSGTPDRLALPAGTNEVTDERPVLPSAPSDENQLPEIWDEAGQWSAV